MVKVNSTDAMVNYSQTLFSLQNIDLYRAAKADERAAYFSKQSSRGLVVLTVGDAYLQALALGAQVANAKALLQADQVLLDQTVAEHQAGTAANLDELNGAGAVPNPAAGPGFGRSQFRQGQDRTQPGDRSSSRTGDPAYRFSALCRPGDHEHRRSQANRLPEPAGLPGFAGPGTGRPIAAESGQMGAAANAHLSGQLWRHRGDGGGFYHGTFAAQGSLNLPIFEEAKFRGDSGVAAANLTNLTEQLAALKEQINQQLRDSILDVETATELVRVAQSNVDLARTELEQTTERFQAGVDDNLPVVQAQATLADAETTLVNTTSQHNQAKLGLARNLGIVDTQYATYVHGN